MNDIREIRPLDVYDTLIRCEGPVRRLGDVGPDVALPIVDRLHCRTHLFGNPHVGYMQLTNMEVAGFFYQDVLVTGLEVVSDLSDELTKAMRRAMILSLEVNRKSQIELGYTSKIQFPYPMHIPSQAHFTVVVDLFKFENEDWIDMLGRDEGKKLVQIHLFGQKIFVNQ